MTAATGACAYDLDVVPMWVRQGQLSSVNEATGCRSKDGAMSMLRQLTDRAEKVRAGVLTQSESTAADHPRTPIAEHFDAYQEHLRVKGNAPRYIKMVRSQLNRVTDECGFERLADLTVCSVEHWLSLRFSEGMSAATRNHYRKALVAFGNWCRRTDRMTRNVVAQVPTADVTADRRLERRALTEDEVVFGVFLDLFSFRAVLGFQGFDVLFALPIEHEGIDAAASFSEICHCSSTPACPLGGQALAEAGALRWRDGGERVARWSIHEKRPTPSCDVSLYWKVVYLIGARGFEPPTS